MVNRSKYKLNKFGMLLLGALAAAGSANSLKAQESRQHDTTQTTQKTGTPQDTLRPAHTLSGIVVNAERQTTPQRISDALGYGNPGLSMYLTVPEISSFIPGVSSSIYKDILLGNVIHKEGIPILLRNDFDFSLTPAYPGFMVELRGIEATATTPAPDMPLKMRARRIESDYFIGLDPTQISGGIGYTRGNLRSVASAQILNAFGINILGQGTRLYGRIELGENQHRRARRLSAEVHRFASGTDFSERLDLERLEEDNEQGLVIVRGENPVGRSLTLEGILGFQSGHTNARIQDYGEKLQNIIREISMFTAGAGLNSPIGNLRLNFHRLHRISSSRSDSLEHDSSGFDMRYSVFQVSGDGVYTLPLGFGLRLNSRIDAVNDVNGSPFFSFYTALEKQISNLTPRIRWGHLHDVLIPAALRPPLEELFPSTEAEIQNIDYAEVDLEARFGHHTLRASAGLRSMNMPVFDSQISGQTYHLSYQWSNDNAFLIFSMALRNMDMRTSEGTQHAPGSEAEQKIVFGMQVAPFTFGMSAARQNNFYFPVERRRLIDLGKRVIINPFFSAQYRSLSASLTLVNMAGVLERLGLTDSKNILAVYGPERKGYDMPVLANFGIRYWF